MKRQTLLLSIIVPIVMIFFFIRNIVLVESENMDSWMGGGMRMFGKVDKMLYRVSGMTIKHKGKEYFLNFRNFPDLEETDVELRILPSTERLKKTLDMVRRLNWCLDSNTNSFLLSGANCGIKIDPSEIISISVYRTHFDDYSNTVSLKLIDEYVDK